MLKRFLAVLAILVMATFVLAACTGGNGNDEQAGTAPGDPPATTPADPPGQTGDISAAPTGPAGDTTRTDFTILVAALPVSMDPIQSNDNASSMVNNMLYSTLIYQSSVDLSVHPSLAESWEFVDAQTLNMVLRRDVVFHNGDPMTAHDIKFSIERGAVSDQVEIILGMIDSVTVHNDYEFTIHLDFPFAPILSHLAHPAAGILPMNHLQGILDSMGEEDGLAHFADNPVGAGPFAFNSIVLGDAVTLVRNNNYWGHLPVIETLIYRLVPDPSSRLMAVETGEAQFAQAVAPADIAVAEASPNVTMMRRPNMTIHYIGFNNNRAPFDDYRVRQAIHYALDTRGIVQNVFMGAGAPAQGPLSSQVWGFHPTPSFDLGSQGANFERAQELLTEAGFPDGFDAAIWWNIPNTQRSTIAEMVQFQLGQIGINVSIHSYEWPQILDETERADGEHEMFIMAWGTVTGDPDYGLFPLFHSSNHGGAGNRTFFSNDEIDRLLDAGRLETDPAARLPIYAEAMEVIRDQSPWVFLWEGEELHAVSNDMNGLILNPAGHHNFATVWFE
ncbi:MAG: ABC transporter substrate-binding protein [Defluviitaleaceae bacterium]|nr:ABC transporter substrate-binding protein [Defluviitaleaceae bacterium]